MAKAARSYGTKIFKCDGANCKSPYQDRTYGVSMRVFNIMGKPGASAADRYARCTICLAVKAYTESAAMRREDKRGDAPVSASAVTKGEKPKDNNRDAKAQKGRKG